MKFSCFLELLLSQNFIQVHKSFIIARKHIEVIEATVF
ncbi:LytTR family transcriptional regulator DNA-binding domain-containing protein [Robertkochia solimangrovi]|nr:hypothetical protein DMZ48_16510 [Robertkochia solimangrovi]